MGIISKDADIFQLPVVAIVNPVNTVGVMGSGLAAQFKKRFPLNYEIYKARCADGHLRVGRVLSVFESGKVIVNFPTKDDWRYLSKINYIEAGLWDLRRLLLESNLPSIAIPALGCGLGALDWAQVQPRIEEALGHFEVPIYVIPPKA